MKIPLTPLHFLKNVYDHYPDKIALVYQDRKITWNEYYYNVLNIANTLNEICKPKTNICVLMKNIPEHFQLYYAIPLIGCVIISINYRLDYNSIANILDNSDAEAIIYDSEFDDLVENSLNSLNKNYKKKIKKIRHQDQKSLESKGSDNDYFNLFDSNNKIIDWDKKILEIEEETYLTIIYTNGSTKNPKGAIYKHKTIFLKCLINSYGIHFHNYDFGNKFLQISPLYHISGINNIWYNTVNKLEIYCIKNIDYETIIYNLEKYEINNTSGSTGILEIIVKKKKKFKNTLNFLLSGTPLFDNIINKAKEKNIRIMHSWGMTETNGRLNNFNQNNIKFLENNELLTKLKLIDKDSKEILTNNNNGELLFHNRVCMDGYYKNQQETNETIINGWIHTGDIFVRNNDEKYKIVDRKEDIINSKGEDITTFEIENLLLNHKNVSDCAVIGISDKKYGEVPCAFIVKRKNVTPDEIIKYCKNNMETLKCPKKIVFLPEIPKIEGLLKKIDKKKLRKKFNL
jgi:fatty-acyl-CoA synthase